MPSRTLNHSYSGKVKIVHLLSNKMTFKIKLQRVSPHHKELKSTSKFYLPPQNFLLFFN